ncbi:hypothetical protein [Mesorhizobium sp.]|uniref:hypothetical protein n=1 Tax=Mesorhizobium sp. TaxID=1871066 RepID=UPI00120E9033|nr:hypothetical protein [Mesorhizobium sp.]TIO11086.1 MAG: hypothetical protein E5X88_00850 [Mesorhizobium sp.]TIO33667.1 MAG: hypothetical protein E5X89_15805 [Mesorhizobium sp.]
MDRFIARANIAHFRDLLACETDPEQRRVIEGLLALEQKKLEIAEGQARDQSREPGSPGSIARPSR